MSYPGVVVNQPFTNVQIPMTAPVAPGLEYLAHVDQLIVKQQVELFEVLTGFETRNKYRVMNSQEQQVYFVAEESDLCHRQCCGPSRGFIFHFLAMSPQGPQQEVMRLERPFLCCKGSPCCADGCCMYPIYVKDAAGQMLGIVRMVNFYCAPRFGVFDPNGKPLFVIQGECCPCQGPCCTDDINFPVYNAGENTQIANIAKQWGGCGRECITDADNVGVTFPMNMSIQHKALLLASIFLIDITMYEKKNN